jgi:hypothetical protein
MSSKDRASDNPPMALSFLYLMTRRLLRVLLGRLRSEHAKDVEIAVLRHQLAVLRRHLQPPQFQPADRSLLPMLSGAQQYASLAGAGRSSWWPRARSCGGTAGWWPASGTQPYRRGGRPPLSTTWWR